MIKIILSVDFSNLKSINDCEREKVILENDGFVLVDERGISLHKAILTYIKEVKQ